MRDYKYNGVIKIRFRTSQTDFSYHGVTDYTLLGCCICKSVWRVLPPLPLLWQSSILADELQTQLQLQNRNDESNVSTCLVGMRASVTLRIGTYDVCSDKQGQS